MADETVHRVLIVEDEMLIAMELQGLVEECGHTVCGLAATAEAAIEAALDERPSVILMDVRLAGARDGIEAAQEIAQAYQTSVIFCTAQTDEGTQSRIDRCRPVAVLNKPILARRLVSAISECELGRS